MAALLAYATPSWKMPFYYLHEIRFVRFILATTVNIMWLLLLLTLHNSDVLALQDEICQDFSLKNSGFHLGWISNLPYNIFLPAIFCYFYYEFLVMIFFIVDE